MKTPYVLCASKEVERSVLFKSFGNPIGLPLSLKLAMRKEPAFVKLCYTITGRIHLQKLLFSRG